MKRILMIAVLAMSTLALYAQKDHWYQYGAKIGTNFPITRDYSVNGDYLSGLKNAEFGVFFRAGKYVFGEIGLGYTFYKGEYDFMLTDTSALYRDVVVTTHHLQIPVKVVGNVNLSKSVTFLPFAGIIYQPLLKVSDNNINFNKNTLNNHPLLVTAGFDLKFGPIVLGVNYRYSVFNFFQNKTGKHPQYINICAGVQF